MRRAEFTVDNDGRNDYRRRAPQPVTFHHEAADGRTRRVAVRICFHPTSDPDRRYGEPGTDVTIRHRAPSARQLPPRKTPTASATASPVRIRLQSDGDPHRYDDKSDAKDDSDDDSAGRRGLHQPGLVVVNLANDGWSTDGITYVHNNMWNASGYRVAPDRRGLLLSLLERASPPLTTAPATARSRPTRTSTRTTTGARR